MDMDSPQAPQITTIIPTYRRPRLLKRAIESVLRQDFASLRVAVFDNASGDETPEVVAGFAREDPRVFYFCHETNVGAAANFESGLRTVQTPFFSILSDDDYLLPGFYRRAVADLEESPGAAFWAGLTLNVDESGKIWDARVLRWPREGRFEPPDGALLITGGLSPTWTGILFRKDVLDGVGFPDQETLGPSDLDFVLKIAAQYPFVLRKIPAAVFTLNQSSFSATQPLSSFWPGWQKMFQNVSSLHRVEASRRKELLDRLHADARRMLFRRGANAVAHGRNDFALEAAGILRSEYGLRLKPALLEVVSTISSNVPAAGRVCRYAYSWLERRLVASRSASLRQYAAYLRKG
jgi:glycosyltransferase involved in cell wall biosynthesis